MSRRSRWIRIFTVALALLGAVPRPGAADSGDAQLEAAAAALAGWDLEAARLALDGAAASSAREVKLGVLAIYEGRYAEAESHLAAALAAGDLPDDGPDAEEAKHFLALARGSQRALDGAIEMTSPDGFVVAVFADEKDALLAPYLFDAMAVAREALGEDLGVRP
jgi:hypothetical protein